MLILKYHVVITIKVKSYIVNGESMGVCNNITVSQFLL
jgi:hypothetical protein